MELLTASVRVRHMRRHCRGDASEHSAQVLVRAEVDPEARRLAARGDRQTPEHAAQALSVEDLREAVDRSRVRVAHVREHEARLALTLDLHPGLGQLHRTTDDRLRKTGERARPEVRPQTRFVAHVPMHGSLDAKNDGVDEGDAVQRRCEPLVETFHLQRQAAAVKSLRRSYAAVKRAPTLARVED